MKRLLSSTTVISMALVNIQPWPLFAQQVTDSGAVIAADGTVLCEPTADAACDPNDPSIQKQAKKIDKRMAKEAAAAEEAAAAAAQAEADATAQAQKDAEAAAAAQAEADATAQAHKDADAAAAAQAEADAAAQAQKDAEAAAAAQADADAAQAQKDAEAAAAAQAEADAAAQAQKDADAAAAAQADADAAQAQKDAEAAAGAQAEADAAAQAQKDADAAATAQAEADAAAALAAAQAELPVQADGTFIDPSAGLKTAEVAVDPNAVPVDAPIATETEVQTVVDLLTQPATAEAAVIGAAATEAAVALVPGEKPSDAAPSTDAVTTMTEVLTGDSVRASTQEFAAAPVQVSQGKKDRLSDLEKFGLVALGALAIGTIIYQNNKANTTTASTSGAPAPQVVSNTGDRVVVLNPDGTYTVYKDDDAVIRQPGSTVRTETYKDGSTRTIIERADGSQIVTIRDALGRVLRRAAYDRNGNEMVLIDDLRPETPVVVSTLPKPATRPVVISTSDQNAALKAALAANDVAKLGRSFSLRQIRDIPQVRWLAPTIDVDPITFDSGSAAIKASQAAELADLGRFMQDLIDQNPREIFLIEGHTDATGLAAMNLALSDRRAESVALALTEYFDIPPENMVIQGYGETELLVDTQANEPRNRRVGVRIITQLLNGA